MGPYYDNAQLDRFSHARDASLNDDLRHIPAHLLHDRRDRITGTAGARGSPGPDRSAGTAGSGRADGARGSG